MKPKGKIYLNSVNQENLVGLEDYPTMDDIKWYFDYYSKYNEVDKVISVQDEVKRHYIIENNIVYQINSKGEKIG